MDFEITFDYKNAVFTSGLLRYDFNDIQFTHNICAILQKYRNILPNPYDLSKRDTENSDEIENDEVFIG